MFTRRVHRLLTLLVLVVVCASLLVSQPFTVAAAMAPHMTRTAFSGPYKIVLSIGPVQKMYSMADYKKMHPKTGEIMLSGTMMMNDMGSMGAGSMLTSHHLEVHVYSKASGKVVRNANVSIAITDLHTKKTTEVPVVTMEGIGAGPQDYHYGNNVALMTEHYRVSLSINGRHLAFTIYWQEAQPSMSM